MTAMLEARGLAAGYGAKTVIQGLDLAIQQGDFAALIGPNGSGKSTLVKCLTGYLAPSLGEILFAGRPIRGYRRRDLARELAIVQQFMPEPLPFRVRDFIMVGRYPHRGLFEVASAADREAVENAAELTRTAPLMERKLTELSGGERQMVYLARALAQGPRCIILDEPVSHLDIAHAVRIMDVLAELHRRGATIVVVLHDINLASEYAGRVVALKEGRLFADGTPAEVVEYRIIEGLFDTTCVVRDNPISGRPFTYPVPGRLREMTGR